MKDAARAEQAYRMHDPRLAAVWNGPPTQERKRPGRDPRANFENLRCTNTVHNTEALDVGQRGIETALRRAGQLERRAGLLAEVGQRDAALRLSELAGGLRAVAV